MDDVFETKHSEVVGRYIQSKKKFEPGDTVFVEDPALLSPSSNTWEDLSSGNFLCLGCSKVVTKEICMVCANCGWYACNKTCLEETWHADFECSLFNKEKVIPSYVGLKYIYLVRSLLMKEKEPDKFAAILNLSSDRSYKSEHFEKQFEDRASEACVFLKEQCKMEVDIATLERIIHIYAVNAFCLAPKDLYGNEYIGGGLFAICCLLCHSCYPNTEWFFLPCNDSGIERCRMTLIASKTIEIGDAISIAYVNYDLYGTIERRLKLATTMMFLCQCVRCVDRTELGTYFTGIICSTCEEVMVPSDPLDLDPLWACAKCFQTLSKLAVEKLEENFGYNHDAILKNFRKAERCKQLDSLILNCQTKYLLFKNHRHVLFATMNWLSRMNLDILLGTSEEVDQIFATLMRRAKHCRSVYFTIGALYNWVCCEFLIAKVIIKYRFKSKTCLSIVYDDYSVTGTISILKRILNHLKLGMDVMKRFKFQSPPNKFIPNPDKVFDFYSERLKRFYQSLPNDYFEPLQNV